MSHISSHHVEPSEIGDYRENHWNDLACIFHKGDLHNKSVPGLGKTTATMELLMIDVQTHPDHRWIVAVPEHRLIEGENNILAMLDGTPGGAAHIKGKARDNPFYNDMQCYVDGCSRCDHSEDCPYLNQRWHAQILVCPYEMLYTLVRHIGVPRSTGTHTYRKMEGWWGLVFEEEPTRAWFQSLELTPDLLPYVVMEDEQTIPYWGGSYHFFNHITFQPFDVDTVPKYRLYQCIEFNTDFHVHEYNGRYTLFCHRKHMVPRWINHVVLNCATTPSSLRSVMFGRRHFTEFHGKAPMLSNNILRVGYKWGVKMAEKYKAGLYHYLEPLHTAGRNIFLITKLELEPFFADVVTESTHFGSARGFNNFNKDYDLVVVYGGFHWTPLARLMFTLLGVMDDIINELEDAEVVQAVNRCRPYFRPDTPIIIASNYSVLDNKEWSIVGQCVFSEEEMQSAHVQTYQHTLDRFTHCYVNKQYSRNDLILMDRRDGMSVKALAEKYHMSARQIRRIYGMDKYVKTTSIV